MLLTVTLKGGGILCTLFLGKHIMPFISHPGVGLPTNKFNHTFPNQEKKNPCLHSPNQQKSPSHSSGREIKTLHLHSKSRKETLPCLLLLEGIIHQDVVEIDLGCGKMLPRLWII